MCQVKSAHSIGDGHSVPCKLKNEQNCLLLKMLRGPYFTQTLIQRCQQSAVKAA